MTKKFVKDTQYYKFCLYGFFKNLRLFDPFLILFFLEKGINFFQIGSLIAIREIFANIFEIPSGVIADAIGRRKALIVSFVFYIFSFLIFFYSIKYSFFIVAMIFYAFGDAFRTGTHKAMIFDYLKLKKWDNQRAHYYGHTRSWSQMGSAFSSIIAAFIVFYSGSYKSIFLYSTIPYLLDLMLIISYPSFLDGNHKSFEFHTLKDKFVYILKDFLNSFKNIQIIKAVGNLSIHSGLHKSIKDYLQPIIQTFAISLPFFAIYTSKQKSALFIGTLYFMLYILTSIASRNAGKLKDKIKSSERALNITMYSGFVLTTLIGLFYHQSFFLLSIILFFGTYLIENIRNPIGVAYISELYDDKILATALSANSQTKSLLAIIFAPTIGYMADIFGIGIALTFLSLSIILISPLVVIRSKKQT